METMITREQPTLKEQLREQYKIRGYTDNPRTRWDMRRLRQQPNRNRRRAKQLFALNINYKLTLIHGKVNIRATPGCTPVV